MPTSCPNCGTLLESDAVGVCPACHHRLRKMEVEGATEDSRWCESCGSPIPRDANVCPECGMPAKGAFDEETSERFSVRAHTPDAEGEEAREVELKSAIPPAPTEGEARVSTDERRKRERMLLVAALAALLLVGGTTLYIARPWDPYAYRTHATEDADTSMEGFPGEKNHLSSQDLREEEEYKAEVSKNAALLDSVYERLGKLGNDTKQAHNDLVTRLDGGSASGDSEEMSAVFQIQQELNDIKSELEDMDTKDAQQQERSKELTVLMDYLRGAVDVLANAWSALASNNASLSSVSSARGIMNGGVGTRGFDEWYELFSNAYES